MNTRAADPVFTSTKATAMPALTRRLVPAAVLCALVGLSGCHVSFGSGSQSQSPSSSSAKPAHRSPSKARSTSGSGKQVNRDSGAKSGAKKAPSKAASEPAKTDAGPKRTEPTSSTTDPKRKKTTDPKRTKPSDPERNPRMGGRDKADPKEDRPGGLTTTEKPDDPAPGSLRAPQ